MPYFGSVWTAALGPPMYQFASITGERVANTLVITVEVLPEYRERYYYLILNGIYVDSYYCDAKGIMKCTVPPAFGNASDSVYFEDGGLVGSPNEEDLPLITYNAQLMASNDAARIYTKWDCIGQYETSSVVGTSQLSNVVITGAVRGKNCEKLDIFPSRGRVQITIENSGTTRTVRLYSGLTLVAEGSLDGDGEITVNPVEATGIEMVADIVYTGPVSLNTAWIDLQWPVGWYIHCSPDTLTFPRTAEYWVPNSGGDVYSHLTPVLDADVYNVAIVALDDEGDSSTPLTVDGSPFTIKTVPPAPTITSVVETSPYHFTVNFTSGGASAVSHTVYFSNVNDSINGIDPAGGLITGGPTPVVTATNSAAIVVNSFTPDNFEPAFNTMVLDISTAVTAITDAYAVGETGFTTVLAAQITIIQDAVATFGTAIRQQLRTITDELVKSSEQIQSVANSNEGNDYLTEEWQSYIAPSLAIYLQFLGVMLYDNATLFVIPGYGLSGEQYTAVAEGLSLYEIASPLSRPNVVRILVRAKNSDGYEEKNGNIFTLFIDNAGSKVLPVPNDPVIEDIDIGPASSVTVTANNTSQTTGTGTSLSWSHTVGSGSNRAIIVWLYIYGTTPAVTSATIGGNALTLLNSYSPSGGTVKVYYYVAPSSGSQTISFTLTGSGLRTGGISTDFYNVHQSSTIGTTSFVNASGTLYTSSIPEPAISATGDIILGSTDTSDFVAQTLSLDSNLTRLGTQITFNTGSYYYDFTAFKRVSPSGLDLVTSFNAVDYASGYAFVLKAVPPAREATIEATLYSDDQLETASHIDYYLESESGTYNFTAPDDSVAISNQAIFNTGKYRASSTLEVSGSGWFKVAVKSRNATTGKRSEGYSEEYFYVSSSNPLQPNNAVGNVQGARGK